MPDRVYCPEPVANGRVAILDEEARHLARVRRAEPGDEVEVFDGRGGSFPARVVEIARDRVILEWIGQATMEPPPVHPLTLATAVPKGDRFDWLVEKASELGVTRLLPLLTERSVVDPRSTKLDRLRRLAIESAKQSGRNRLMELTEPVAWTELVGEFAEATRLIAHPGGLRIYRWPRVGLEQAVVLAIGPEGGFTESEIDQARTQGWDVVGLGVTKLRVETAGLAGCSILLAMTEELDS